MLVTVFDSSETPLGQGSGFLIDSQGTLGTNYHVVKYASSAIAKSANGAFYKVKGVLAVDVTNDLAVLRLDGSGFTYLTLGFGCRLLWKRKDDCAKVFPSGARSTLTLAGAICSFVFLPVRSAFPSACSPPHLQMHPFESRKLELHTSRQE
jgi:hypothetical protein